MQSHSTLRKHVALLLSCVAVSATLGQKSNTDEAAIRAARARSNRAIAAHDVEGTVSVMAPGFISVSSRNSRDLSREDARTGYRELFATRKGVVFVRTPSVIEVNREWRHAAEQGKWTGRWSTDDGDVRVGGTYFAKWLEIRGEWKLLTETFVQTSCVGKSYCEAAPSVPSDTTEP